MDIVRATSLDKFRAEIFGPVDGINERSVSLGIRRLRRLTRGTNHARPTGIRDAPEFLASRLHVQDVSRQYHEAIARAYSELRLCALATQNAQQQQHAVNGPQAVHGPYEVDVAEVLVAVGLETRRASHCVVHETHARIVDPIRPRKASVVRASIGDAHHRELPDLVICVIA